MDNKLTMQRGRLLGLRLSEGLDRTLPTWLALDRLRGQPFFERGVDARLPTRATGTKCTYNFRV